MPASFVPLHLHSHFSLLDSSAHVPAIVKRAAELDFPAVALTDHGNMSGSVQLWRECRANKIHAVVGSEIYMTVGDHTDRTKRGYNHLVLLAMNDVGYRNLCAIVSEGYLRGFYYKPRISLEYLREHSEGLIAGAACLAGWVAAELNPKHHEFESEAVEAGTAAARELAAAFPGRFYLEFQDHGIPEQRTVNERLVKVAAATGLPAIFTNDSHFIDESDYESHCWLKCMGNGERVAEMKRVYTPAHKIRSEEEMRALGNDYPEDVRRAMDEAVSRTVDVAELCDFGFPSGKSFAYHFPTAKVPEGSSTAETFRSEVLDGYERRAEKFVIGRGEEYASRLFYELGVIEKMGFQDYFLIVADLIRWAKGEGIPMGPGRGSAAGSLVSYCLGITEIDPIRHGLLFERFLNPERVSMPDIDIDVSKRDRHRLIEYTVAKYGRENVAQIITFGTMAARAALKDAGRVLGLSVPDQCRLANVVPQTPGNPFDLKRTLEEIPEAKDLLAAEPRFQDVWNIACKLEKTNRNASLHAAGVVITPEPVVAYAPLFKQSKDGDEGLAAAYDMRDLETIGLVKMDYLGLKTLDLVKDVAEMVGDEELDLDDLPLDDPQVMEIFAEGNTKGVFQFESPGMRAGLVELRPTEFGDLVAMNALYRPGPLDAGMMASFIKRKNGREDIVPLHPDLEDILASTYGVMVYQEQIMQIFRRLAGYSLGQADVVRKAMGKKNAEMLKRETDKFIEAAVGRGYDRADMERIVEAITAFGRYAFNLAHATAYSYVAWQTAYLKKYYPAEFMCALLTNEAEDAKPEKVQEYIGDAKRMGLEVRPPDVNYSAPFFSLEPGTAKGEQAIRYGLAGISGVGEDISRRLIEERAHGEYKNLSDFLHRMPQLNKRTTEALIFAGATGSLGGHPAQHHANFERLTAGARRAAAGGSRQLGLLESEALDEIHARDLVAVEPWPEVVLAAKEKQALGLWLSYHPLNDYKTLVKDDIATMREAAAKTRAKILCVVVGVVRRRIGSGPKVGQEMVVLTVEDLTGSIEGIIFGDKDIAAVESCLQTGKVVWLTGNVRQGNGKPGLYVDGLEEVQ
jgi:DNA polymerase-3 subunit alpha